MSEFNTIANTSIVEENELLINQLLNDDINYDNSNNKCDCSYNHASDHNHYHDHDQYHDQYHDQFTENTNETNTNETNTTETNTTNTTDQKVYNELHSALYEMAVNIIPEMLIPTEMIILNGEINGLPVNILLDTGASTSVIFSNAINKLNLHELIDIEQSSMLEGIGKEKSLGQIWYIELKLNGNIYPISLVGSNNRIKDFDMILGINFLRSYKALIDFKNKTLTLNDKYEIKFK